jgi:hypothetical protein
VSEAGSTVVVPGPCGTVTVTGDGATVTLGASDRIVIDADDVTLVGASTGSVEVRGSRCTVRIAGMTGEFTDHGRDNNLVGSD